ncbi:hypothetical protein IC229_00350 [Spirosoma sp. BT702]|uniref:Galactose oxidase n=1 Tax=Spirosoma profusum TaxID=2771354 RepID=A0A926XSH4_9BACT|nr:hypothetical protein [Spirosoma profusum]MBD2699068.1 hypothetical protein [Spirosoma profusum]
MVFADHLNAFVVYGGFLVDFQHDSTTWLLKDGQFTALKLPGPGARGNFGMAYDPLRKKVVLFGGKFSSKDMPADLWEFDGQSWTHIPVENIGIISGRAMTYSPDQKQVIIHGTIGETWGWNGKKLTKLASGGPLESGIALEYDTGRHVLAAYGGFGPGKTASSSLWELQNGLWNKVSDNGTWVQVGLNKYVRMP